AHKQKNFLSKQYAEMNPDQRLIEMSNNEAPPDNSNEVKKRKSTRLKNVEEPPAKRTYTRKKPISSTTQKRINFPTLASSSSQQVRSQSQNM
ncbi:641_t:CDS:2, partial [Scutellospora calospora]